MVLVLANVEVVVGLVEEDGVMKMVRKWWENGEKMVRKW